MVKSKLALRHRRDWTPQGPELTGLIKYLCISNGEPPCTTDHMSEIATIRLSRISNNAELP
jgi:hypothetical protein